MDAPERAARAVRKFSTMTNGLTSYVRAMTGNQSLIVRAAPITSTDGHFVNIRPPLALADYGEHDRRLCDRRDPETTVLLCPACERMESVYSSLYHEMSHIVCGSLSSKPIEDLREYVVAGATAAKADPEFLAYVDKNMDAFEKKLAASGMYSTSIYEVANAAHPYMVGILRATDDYTIEQAAFRARSGVRAMLYYTNYQIMTRGIENPDGTMEMWSDQPTEAQLPIALLLELHGWGLDGKFSDEVIAAIKSPGIQALAEREIPDPDTALAAAAGYLVEFNRLGYYLVEEDQEPEESESGDESDETSEEKGDEGGASSDESGEGEGESSESENESGSGGSPDSHGSPDDDSSEESDSGSGGSEKSESDAEESDSNSSDGSDAGDNNRGNDNDDPTAGSKPGGSGSGDNSRSDGGVPDVPDSEKASPADIERAMTQATGHEQADKVMEEGYAQGDAYGDSSSYDPDDPFGDGLDDNGDSREPRNGNYEVDIEAVTREQMEVAVAQAMFFDDVSREVGRVIIYRDEGPAFLSSGARTEPVVINESIVAGAILRARRVFSDNALDKHVQNLKKGKLSPRALGARGWGDDHRVFRKKIRANKTDYEVVIGGDISGSTSGGALTKIMRAMTAMGELLNRVGVPFSMYLHTTGSWSDSMNQNIYVIKDLHDAWNDKSKGRLSQFRSYAGSLDGHNFEFYRKVLMRSEAKKRLCVYYTDGHIPETNHYEERNIMERESKLFTQLDFEALIVAVGIELPNAYGFDQVKLNAEADIVKVLNALEKKITKGKL